MVNAVRPQRAIDAMSSLLEGAPSVYVPGGARITGGRADAFVRIDWAEHQRRQRAGLHGAGLKAMTQLWVLDLLMNLPLGEPVAAESLSSDEQWVLARMPAGALDRDGRWVIRRCRPVAEITAVVVWGRHLPAVLRQTEPFTRVAQRMAVLDRVPADFDDIAWQARYHGTGVWAATGEAVTELVAAEPVRHRYYKPARWKANEYAYRAWLTAAAPEPVHSSQGCRA